MFTYLFTLYQVTYKVSESRFYPSIKGRGKPRSVAVIHTISNCKSIPCGDRTWRFLPKEDA